MTDSANPPAEAGSEAMARVADPRAGGQVPRRRAEHRAQVGRRRTAAGVLHARRATGGSAAGDLDAFLGRLARRGLRRAGASSPRRRRRRRAARVRPRRTSRPRGTRCARPASAERGPGRARRGAARPHPPRRDDAEDGRLGDALGASASATASTRSRSSCSAEGRATPGTAAERGAQAFIGKPFDPEQLLAADQAAAPLLSQY